MEYKDFKKLYSYLNKSNGIFLEAGANDGIADSYTYYLEKEYNWTGILIEPSIKAYEACKQNRLKSTCINTALVGDDRTSISGDFDGHLMASINGARLNRGSTYTSPATTLTKIFSSHLQQTLVDLMSIDVENYEYEVLSGLDYKLYKPTYILAEIYTDTFEKVQNFLIENGYELIDNITGFNLKDNPGWDGTHNDYLFKIKT